MSTSSLKSGGSTWRWRRIRSEVLARDGNRCRYCGEWANTADHVIRRADGGGDDLGNLVACCKDCQTPAKRPGQTRSLDRGHPTDTIALSVSLPSRWATRRALADDHSLSDCGLLVHGWITSAGRYRQHSFDGGEIDRKA